MSDQRHDPEYIVEYADGPLVGTSERRYLVDGKVDERIGAIAAVEGLESTFWYVAGEEREFNGEKYVMETGLVADLEARLSAAVKRPGRPRELPVRALLVGLLVLAHDGTMHLTRLHELLNRLEAADRVELGLTRAGGITRRQTQRLYANIADVLDVAAFDACCALLLEATQPDEIGGPEDMQPEPYCVGWE